MMTDPREELPDYSQHKEQPVILDYFAGFIGVALDCGANDGKTLSMSKALHDLGWLNVCVEPSPRAFQLLKQNQPNSHHIQAALAEKDGSITLYESGSHISNADVALLSTTKEGEMDRWKNTGTKFTAITVPAMTVATMLKACPYTYFDFISIDCEGVDYTILTQMDLTKMRCRMLCVEYNGQEPKKYVDYCAKHGLKLHHRNAVNLIFAK